MIIKKNIWKRYELYNTAGKIETVIDRVVNSSLRGKCKVLSFDLGPYRFIKFNNNRMIIEWRGYRYFVVIILGEVRIRADEIN